MWVTVKSQHQMRSTHTTNTICAFHLISRPRERNLPHSLLVSILAWSLWFLMTPSPAEHREYTALRLLFPIELILPVRIIPKDLVNDESDAVVAYSHGPPELLYGVVEDDLAVVAA